MLTWKENMLFDALFYVIFLSDVISSIGRTILGFDQYNYNYTIFVINANEQFSLMSFIRHFCIFMISVS